MKTKITNKLFKDIDNYYSDKIICKIICITPILYFFDYCKQNFLKNVSLIHNYNMNDFTI